MKRLRAWVAGFVTVVFAVTTVCPAALADDGPSPQQNAAPIQEGATLAQDAAAHAVEQSTLQAMAAQAAAMNGAASAPATPAVSAPPPAAAAGSPAATTPPAGAPSTNPTTPASSAPPTALTTPVSTTKDAQGRVETEMATTVDPATGRPVQTTTFYDSVTGAITGRKTVTDIPGTSTGGPSMTTVTTYLDYQDHKWAEVRNDWSVAPNGAPGTHYSSSQTTITYNPATDQKTEERTVAQDPATGGVVQTVTSYDSMGGNGQTTTSYGPVWFTTYRTFNAPEATTSPTGLYLYSAADVLKATAPSLNRDLSDLIATLGSPDEIKSGQIPDRWYSMSPGQMRDISQDFGQRFAALQEAARQQGVIEQFENNKRTVEALDYLGRLQTLQAARAKTTLDGFSQQLAKAIEPLAATTATMTPAQVQTARQELDRLWVSLSDEATRQGLKTEFYVENINQFMQTATVLQTAQRQKEESVQAALTALTDELTALLAFYAPAEAVQAGTVADFMQPYNPQDMTRLIKHFHEDMDMLQAKARQAGDPDDWYMDHRNQIDAALSYLHGVRYDKEQAIAAVEAQQKAAAVTALQGGFGELIEATTSIQVRALFEAHQSRDESRLYDAVQQAVASLTAAQVTERLTRYQALLTRLADQAKAQGVEQEFDQLWRTNHVYRVEEYLALTRDAKQTQETETARVAAEAQQAELARRAAEAARLAEETHRADLEHHRQAEEARLAEQARLTEAARQDVEARAATIVAAYTDPKEIAPLTASDTKTRLVEFTEGVNALRAKILTDVQNGITDPAALLTPDVRARLQAAGLALHAALQQKRDAEESASTKKITHADGTLDREIQTQFRQSYPGDSDLNADEPARTATTKYSYGPDGALRMVITYPGEILDEAFPVAQLAQNVFQGDKGHELLIRTLRRDGQNAVRSVTTYLYTDNRLTSATTLVLDPRAQGVVYAYDDQTQTTEKIYADKTRSDFYDATGRVTKTSYFSLSPLLNRVIQSTVSYDPLDSTTDLARRSVITRELFDADQHVTSVAHFDLTDTASDLDARRMVTREWYGSDGTVKAVEKRFVYDDQHRLIQSATYPTDGRDSTEPSFRTWYGGAPGHDQAAFAVAANGDAYLVRGVADIPPGSGDDQRFKPGQRVNGYVVNCERSRTAPDLFGLTFSNAEGQEVFVEYPAAQTVQLGGNAYDIQLRQDGALALERHFTTADVHVEMAGTDGKQPVERVVRIDLSKNEGVAFENGAAIGSFITHQFGRTLGGADGYFVIRQTSSPDVLCGLFSIRAGIIQADALPAGVLGNDGQTAALMEVVANLRQQRDAPSPEGLGYLLLKHQTILDLGYYLSPRSAVRTWAVDAWSAQLRAPEFQQRLDAQSNALGAIYLDSLLDRFQALGLLAKSETDVQKVIQTLGLSKGRADIFTEYGILVLDSSAKFSESDVRVVRSLLGYYPKRMIENLGIITKVSASEGNHSVNGHAVVLSKHYFNNQVVYLTDFSRRFVTDHEFWHAISDYVERDNFLLEKRWMREKLYDLVTNDLEYASLYGMTNAKENNAEFGAATGEVEPYFNPISHPVADESALEYRTHQAQIGQFVGLRTMLSLMEIWAHNSGGTIPRTNSDGSVTALPVTLDATENITSIEIPSKFVRYHFTYTTDGFLIETMTVEDTRTKRSQPFENAMATAYDQMLQAGSSREDAIQALVRRRGEAVASR